jgi:flavin-dependent dehydrogenase
MLARAGRRVLLLEKAGAGGFKIGEALPPAARPLLHDLGVWDRFVIDGHLPCYGNLSAWGTPLLHGTDFIYDCNGHGWHLDRARFDALLRETAHNAGAEVREATVLKRLTYNQVDGGWRVILSNQEEETEVRCRWLVDASGRRSVVARRQGGQCRADDRLISFFALFRPAESVPHGDRDARTLIEAAPDGWWYTALLPSKQRVVAYLTDADLVTPRAMRAREGFLALVDSTEHIRACLAAYSYVLQTPPKGAPAHSGRLHPCVGTGWLATGDAALSFDPLSSQGILTALYTGMRAAQALDAHLWDAEAMDHYARRLELIYAAYLQNRCLYYTFEGRWPERRFWKRRRDAGTSSSNLWQDGS